MDLYTLDSGFLKNNVIDQFSSVVWTERYSDPGDVSLVVDPTPSMISQLAEGTFLALSGSNEVMILSTQSIEDGKLTVTGFSLLEFLRQRAIIPLSAAEYTSKSWIIEGLVPGTLLSYIVDKRCISILDPGAFNQIANLTFGAIDTSGTAIKVSVPFGPVLDALKSIAETYALGMSLYLNAASAITYDLRFKVYKGIDRSDPALGPIVQFSPALDSLTNVKELRSLEGYKTLAYVVATTEPNLSYAMQIAEAYTGAYSTAGFGRRVMIVLVDDLNIASVAVDPAAPTVDEINRYAAALIQRGKDALANNNYTRVVDGEVVPQSDFQFGVHYNLGDIVQLQGYSQLTQKARITEYIRSQDSSGERAYPTVSVID